MTIPGGGPYHASSLFDLDPEATAAEVLSRGWVENARLHRLAILPQGAVPEPDLPFLCRIHSGWFASTFPDSAGRLRSTNVANRKGTAATVEQGLAGLVRDALDTYRYRLDRLQSGNEPVPVQYAGKIDAINQVIVRIYDIHPFVDGNTRTTFSFRNFLLESQGFDRLGDEMENSAAFDEAWWTATPDHLDHLNRVVMRELAAVRRRRLRER